MTTAQSDPLLRYVRQLVAGGHFQERSDQELLEEFAGRSKEAAFAALVSRHGPMVLRVCRRVLGHEQDAEDAFQATFLVLAQNSKSIRKQAALPDWLHGVAFRTAMKAKRTAIRRRLREEQVLPKPGHAIGPTWPEVQVALDEELRNLSGPFRLAFVLCVLEGKSEGEAATVLGCQKGTVSSRVARARQQLRRRLTRRGIELSALLAATSLANAPAQAVTTALANSTVKYGLLTVAGSKAAGLVPAHLRALAQGVSGIMMTTKLKILAVVVLVLGLVTAGSAITSQLPPAIEAPAGGEREPTTQPRAKATRTTSADAPEAVTYSGRVFGPDKKPVPGAEVYYHFITREEEPIPVRARTDAEGRFSFTLTEKDVPASADRTRSQALRKGQLAVKCPGLALAWHDPSKGTTDLSVHLAADDLPIQGRLVDLQGKPLPGLSVTVLSIAAPVRGDLTAFLQALKPRSSFFAAWQEHLPNTFTNPLISRPRHIPILPSATTGADGRFRLAGFAREQMIELRIEGPSIETQTLFILNRPRLADVEALLVRPLYAENAAYGDRSERAMFRWNTFEHAAPPGQTVVGAVRDQVNKAPIPRAVVESYMLAGTNLGENTIYRTTADGQGRYRFTGLPRGKGNILRFRPAKGQPYLPAVKTVPAKEAFHEAAIDVELARGLFVDVTVRDKRTGKPVAGSVSYFVLPEKSDPAEPFFRPFEDVYNNFMPVSNDGTFRFVALARKAIVAFRTDDETYPIARDAPLVRLPGLMPACNYQAFVTISPKADQDRVKVDFLLDAGGVAKGRLVAPDGRPLAGVLAAGLRHDWYGDVDWSYTKKTGTFTATGLDPSHPRLVCFAQWEKKLAGSAILRGDEAGPVTVRLQPWAEVRGRLLDKSGKPIKNATLWFTEVPVGKVGRPRALDVGLHVVERLGGKPCKDPRSDEEGRFNIEALVPGLKYNLALMDSREALDLEQIKWQGLVFRSLVFQPGKTRDLGDVTLQPFPKE